MRAALARDKEKAIEAAVSTAVLKRTSELNIAREKAMAALGTKLEVCSSGRGRMLQGEVEGRRDGGGRGGIVTRLQEVLRSKQLFRAI